MTLSRNPHDFEFVSLKDRPKQAFNRHVLTYWQDAFLRFRRKKAAVFSALFIFFIACLGALGPFFFPKLSHNNISYYNHQNPDFRNQLPTLGANFLVVEDDVEIPEDEFSLDFDADQEFEIEEGAQLLPPKNFHTRGLRSVNGVTLVWDPVQGASGYDIYRTFLTKDLLSPDGRGLSSEGLIRLQEDAALRGVVVGQILSPDQISFTDLSGLNPSETYVYTIVSKFYQATSGEDLPSQKGSVLVAHLENVVLLSEAKEIKSEAQVGDRIVGRTLLFGSDALGRDVFARMVQGTRIDFFLATIVPFLCFLIGLIYGTFSAFKGGMVDLLLMRLIEILDTVPEILMMILIQVVLGRGAGTLLLSLILFSWQNYARLLRGEVLRLKKFDFVQASGLMGLPFLKIVKKHIAPNIIAVAIVQISAHIPRVIIAEAVLSFLGLGIAPPEPTWGTVLQEAGHRFQVSPLQFFLPATLMCCTLVAFFLLGDTLRDVLDPKMRGNQ